MMTLPYDQELGPGSWKGGVDGNENRTALITCPKCGQVISLHFHGITDEGNVTPSVCCPDVKCGFHDHIKLEGWKP